MCTFPGCAYTSPANTRPEPKARVLEFRLAPLCRRVNVFLEQRFEMLNRVREWGGSYAGDGFEYGFTAIWDSKRALHVHTAALHTSSAVVL